ncbi:MAG TPA: hypothetical protein IAA07_00905 [Candidatus Lachnoclostridium stercoravium]|uniref:Uncharacterized protein n=1 Tax=Candidatus Lachnoclostridium stercoravium TaxID=2838633 RepID=A0A9D2HFX3_9FIRM|nr:hypothetical protein [Candidatus Lachnoclostridium stercoravium]
MKKRIFYQFRTAGKQGKKQALSLLISMLLPLFSHRMDTRCFLAGLGRTRRCAVLNSYRISMILACVLLLSLTGCGTDDSAPSEPAAESQTEESQTEESQTAETSMEESGSEAAAPSESSPSSEEEAASGSALKVLVRENIHRTDQDGQISSYYAPIYEGGVLYTGFERYTPDDVYLETVEERAYEIDEAGRALAYSPLDQASVTTYVFDEAGRISEYKCIHSNGARLFWYALAYDDSGRLLQKINVNEDGSQSSAVWNYTYDESGNIIRRDDPYGAWTEYTYDEDGYPLTSISYDEDGEQAETWSSFQYVEISESDLPEFMGSVKQWVLADLVY